MKRKISLLSLLLVAALVLGMVPFGAFRTEAYAATEQPAADPDVSGSKKIDKELDMKALDPDHRDAEITLSLPSAEYQNEIDVVFVMDNSSSTMDGKAFSGHVEDLFTSILNTNPNLKINVGVVKFRGYATNMLGEGLVTYTEGDNTIINALSNTNVPGHGTNIHSGLVMAEALLDEDDLPDDHKYVVLLTDGKSYIWNNEKGEPTTYYTQWYRGNQYPMQNGGKPTISQNAGEYNKIAYPIDVLDPKGLSNIFVADPVNRGDFDLFFAIDQSNERLYKELSEDTGFESYAYYAYDGTQPDGTVTPHKTTSGPAILYNKHGDYDTYFEYKPNEKWAGVKYYEANPYLPAQAEDDSYYFTNEINPKYYQYHVDNQQKALFKASHLWADMNEKYNCAAVTYWKNNDSGTTLAKSFHYWLVDNSKYGAEVSESGQVKKMFENISNDILYMVASGTVTDPIPAEFDLKLPESGCPFTIETEKDGALEPSGISDNKWGFGLLNESADGTTASTYKYEVEYDEQEKLITWTINVPVENANKVQLTYTLTIKEESAVNLDPGYVTNGTTTLTYKSTDDGPNDPPHTYDFKIPKVTYTKNVPVIVEHYLEGYVPEDDQNPEGNAASGSSISRLSLVGVAIAATSSNESDYGLKETVETNGMAGDEFTADLLAPIPEGYFFDEATTKEFGYARTATIGEDGLTIKLYYSKNVHKVTYVYEGDVPENAPDVPAEQEYKFGADVPKAEVPTLAGWTFNGWNGEVETMPDEDVIVKGSWEQSNPGGGGNPVTYRVIYKYTGTVPAGAPSTPATKSYTAGAAVPSAGTPSMEGYTFSGWSGEVSVMPSHDVTVTGSWTPVEDPGDETDIDEGDTPLAPGTIDDETDIDDGDTPLAPAETEDTEIDEEATPLSPFTGDSRHTAVWAGISVAALLGIIFLGKKRKING